MTQQELQNLISEVDKAILATIHGKSYTLDTGQSRQTVTRQDLLQLRELRKDLQDELDEITDPGSGILKVYNAPYR